VGVNLIDDRGTLNRGNSKPALQAAKQRLPLALAWLARPSFIYGAIALAVLGPTLAPGYLLTGDMLFAPNMSFPTQIYGQNLSSWASLPYLLVLQCTSYLFPAWVIQKLILFLILWTAGIGAHRLVSSTSAGAYFGGLLYMLNPYVGLRLLLGQWTMLAVFAIIPFAVAAMLELLRSRSLKAAAKVALLWWLAGVFQMHGFYLVGILYMIMGLAALIRHRKNTHLLFSFLKAMALTGGIFTLLNAYWLVSLTQTAFGRITRIPSVALDIFASRGSLEWPVHLEVAAMGGFWSASSLIPHDVIRLWQILFVGTLFLAIYGLLEERKTRWSLPEVAVVGIIGWILAVGAGSIATRPIFEFLWVHIPGFQGFRESHKFVAYIVLMYSYLGGIGFASLFRAMRNHSFDRSMAIRKKDQTRSKVFNTMASSGRAIVIMICTVVPLAYGLTVFNLATSINPTDYPPEWYDARSIIEENNEFNNLLIFPWHSFMKIDWIEQNQRKVANPAGLFFTGNMIKADNIELPKYDSDSIDPMSIYIETILENRNNISNLGRLLIPMNVKYVLLLKEENHTDYSFLYQQSDLKPVVTNSRLTLFANENNTSSLLGVKRDEAELWIDYDIDETQLNPFARESAGSPVEVVRNTPITIHYSNSEYDFVALPLTQGLNRNGWRQKGQLPVGYYLGFMPMFPAQAGAGSIENVTFWGRVVWGYLASTLTLAAILTWIAKGRVSAMLARKREASD